MTPKRRKAPKKTRNPSARCAPVRLAKSKRFNAFVGATVEYRGHTYEIVGCGVGKTSKRGAGKLTEGTYALRNLKTGAMRYVPKRRIRDEAYHRGGRSILGMSGEGHKRAAKPKKRSRASYVAAAKKGAATRRRNARKGR